MKRIHLGDSAARIIRKEARTEMRERIASAPPLKLVPSRKGLAVAFTATGLVGYLTGMVIFWVTHR